MDRKLETWPAHILLDPASPFEPQLLDVGIVGRAQDRVTTTWKRVLRNRTRVGGLMVALGLALLVGCSSQRAAPSATAKALPVSGGSWSLVYADQDIVRAYRNGKSGLLGRNPAGYDSLDDWIGYSRDWDAIVFHRGMLEHDFRLLKGNLQGISTSSSEKIRVWLGDDSWKDFLMRDGKLWVVRGQRRRAELWAYARDGKGSRIASWVIPGTVPIARRWFRPPDIHGSAVAFLSSSSCLLVAHVGSPAVKVLTHGDPLDYAEPGFDAHADHKDQVAFSRDGTHIFIASGSQDAHDCLKVLGIRCSDGRVKTYDISPLIPPSSLKLGSADYVTNIRWLPGTDCLVCEVQPKWAGLSYLALLDTVRGRAQYLPFAVERYQWCVMPAVKSSDGR